MFGEDADSRPREFFFVKPSSVAGKLSTSEWIFPVAEQVELELGQNDAFVKSGLLRFLVQGHLSLADLLSAKVLIHRNCPDSFPDALRRFFFHIVAFCDAPLALKGYEYLRWDVELRAKRPVLDSNSNNGKEGDDAMDWDQSKKNNQTPSGLSFFRSTLNNLRKVLELYGGNLPESDWVPSSDSSQDSIISCPPPQETTEPAAQSKSSSLPVFNLRLLIDHLALCVAVPSNSDGRHDELKEATLLVLLMLGDFKAEDAMASLLKCLFVLLKELDPLSFAKDSESLTSLSQIDPLPFAKWLCKELIGFCKNISSSTDRLPDAQEQAEAEALSQTHMSKFLLRSVESMPIQASSIRSALSICVIRELLGLGMGYPLEALVDETKNINSMDEDEVENPGDSAAVETPSEVLGWIIDKQPHLKEDLGRFHAVLMLFGFFLEAQDPTLINAKELDISRLKSKIKGGASEEAYKCKELITVLEGLTLHILDPPRMH